MNEYYYLNSQNTPQGPHSLHELAQLMASGRVNPTTLIACKGGANWEPLGSVLSQENITPPELQLEPGHVGSCPRCLHDLTPELIDGKMPARCPRCTRPLAPSKPGIWANFCLAMRNYIEFRGRATRAEFWSLQLIVLLGYVLIFGVIIIALGFFLALLSTGEESQTLLETLSADEQELELDDIMQASLGATLCILTIAAAYLLAIFWFFATLLPNISASIRRFHDIGWSGWWVGGYYIACFFLPFIVLCLEASGNSLLVTLGGLLNIALIGLGFLWFILCVLDSQRGANKYGPSSKYPLG